jgi:hypothetical protein
MFFTLGRRALSSFLVKLRRAGVLPRAAPPQFPRCVEDLSAAWIERCVLRPGGFPDVRVVGTEVRPLAVDEGFTSALFLVRPEYADERSASARDRVEDVADISPFRAFACIIGAAVALAAASIMPLVGAVACAATLLPAALVLALAWKVRAGRRPLGGARSPLALRSTRKPRTKASESPPDALVCKICPRWSLAEQVTSTCQDQHLKERWVALRAGSAREAAGAGMGCRVPRHFFTRSLEWTGEFALAMAFVDGAEAGDQLQSLAPQRAHAAAAEIARLHARFWSWEGPGRGAEPEGWLPCFDGLKDNRRILAMMARKCFDPQRSPRAAGGSSPAAARPRAAQEDQTVCSFRAEPRLLALLEDLLLSPPLTVVHGDLRSANVMFSRALAGGACELRPPSGESAGGQTSRDGVPLEGCTIIDWGGLQMGRGVFDVAYLLGTGMRADARKRHETGVLRRYHAALGEGGVDLERYGFEALRRDYDRCLYLAASLYAVPNVYDRGTPTPENLDAAVKVRAVLRQNLQPVLDDAEFVARVHAGLGF